jgi:hypothetical protein
MRRSKTSSFVHRPVVEDEHTYAVRIDTGTLLDAAEHVEQARAHLTPDGQRQGKWEWNDGMYDLTPDDRVRSDPGFAKGSLRDE